VRTVVRRDFPATSWHIESAHHAGWCQPPLCWHKNLARMGLDSVWSVTVQALARDDQSGFPLLLPIKASRPKDEFCLEETTVLVPARRQFAINAECCPQRVCAVNVPPPGQPDGYCMGGTNGGLGGRGVRHGCGIVCVLVHRKLR
jgi:hypothetical protein